MRDSPLQNTESKTIHMRAVKSILMLFLVATSDGVLANYEIDCKTTKILSAGAGIPPQPVGGVFRFSFANGQAWSAPFHQGLLFERIKVEKTRDGRSSVLFTARGFNMAQAIIVLNFSKNGQITVTAKQANTSILAACTDVTKKVAQESAENARKAEIEEFTTQQMQSGMGWYVSRTGQEGFSLKSVRDDFQQKYMNEPKAAIVMRSNDSPFHNHYIMIGPFSSKSEAEAELPRIQADIPYAKLFKIGKRELMGNEYMDNVHSIISRNFR